MADDVRYTAEQLAEAGGVSLRTVRYYVQEGLIDRPLARGPGAHFAASHLRQLRRCQLLKEWGFDLETIRDKARHFQGVLDDYAGPRGEIDRTTMRAVLRAMTGEDDLALTRQQAELSRAVARHVSRKGLQVATGRSGDRVPMADGVDLVVDRSIYDMPSPKELVDIALMIRKVFVRKPDADDD